MVRAVSEALDEQLGVHSVLAETSAAGTIIMPILEAACSKSHS